MSIIEGIDMVGENLYYIIKDKIRSGRLCKLFIYSKNKCDCIFETDIAISVENVYISKELAEKALEIAIDNMITDYQSKIDVLKEKIKK